MQNIKQKRKNCSSCSIFKILNGKNNGLLYVQKKNSIYFSLRILNRPNKKQFCIFILCFAFIYNFSKVAYFEIFKFFIE